VQLSILLLAADRAPVQALSAALTDAGHGVTIATKPEDAVAAVAGYSLVIIDRVPDGTTVADVVGMVRAASPATEIPILAIAQSGSLDERIELLEAGADDVIARPFDQPELMARIEALSLRSQRAQVGPGSAAIGDMSRHRLVTVFSPKGGVGTTTVATNLALVAAEALPNKVLLIDLDLSFGQVASHLNLLPKQTLLELSRDEAALRDTDLFRTYVIHHASGLHILASPPSPTYSALITTEQVEAAMARAIDGYDVVVVDAGTAVDQRLTMLFSQSETVVVPVVPEIPALNAIHTLLDQLAESGAIGSRTLFVLNHAFSRDLLKTSDVETALGSKISADLPYDPIAYLKAVNEGVPVVRGAAKSPVADRMRALAFTVFGTGILGSAPAAARPERRGLFSRR
jgi:pilus assembly protein CpaE